MLREILANRTVQASVVFIVVVVVGSLLYLQHVERENARFVAETAAVARRYEKILERAPQDTAAEQGGRAPKSDAVGGHWHGDEWHAEPHTPNSDGDAHPPNSEPAAYHGDPHFWIPGIAYEELITAHGEYTSEPIIPQEKRERLMDVSNLPYREETKHLTLDQRNQLRVEILVEGFSALDAAKFLISTGYEKYARDYADAALASNPDDFTTLYVWTYLQPEDANRIQGYRRLVEMNPNSARALLNLGGLLIYAAHPLGNVAEAIRYLERAAALDPNLYQGAAYSELGSAYLKLGDGELALKYYKRAQQIYDSGLRRDFIELIEKGEIP